MKQLAAVLLAATFASPAWPSNALQVNARECREAADFIGNAARARGNGMSKQAFVERFEGDVTLLQSLAPKSRWFVYGDAEVRILRAAILDVFDFPMTPGEHEANFLAQCLTAIGEDPGAQPEKRVREPARDDWQRHT